MAPSKKPKGKQNDEITSAEAQQGMVDIDHGRQVSEQLLSKVHSLHQACPPSCGAKGSKASKDNPQCFCYLVPPEGSYRKKGLWQKETVVGEMGRDPAEDKRKVLLATSAVGVKHHLCCNRSRAPHTMLCKCNTWQKRHITLLAG